MCLLFIFTFTFIYCSVIFRPKDPYGNRPLPHLIGSKQWQEKWHIGLVDADDTTENDAIDEMSESSSSPSVESLHSHVPASLSESGKSVWGMDATATVTVTGPSSDGTFIYSRFKSFFSYLGYLYFFCFVVERDMFNEDSKANKVDKNGKKMTPISNSTYADAHSGQRDEFAESIQKIKNPSTNTIFRQSTTRELFANLFDSEPPELDESPTQNSDRKPVNLFLDDDDGDGDFDIFSTKETESQHIIGNASNARPFDQEVVKSFNLFEDENGALFDSSIIEKKIKSSILPSSPPQNASLPNLFNDGPPEDDFDFLTKLSALVSESPIPVVKINVRSYEVEKHPEEVNKNSINAETLSKSVTEKTPEKRLLSKISLFDDDDNDDDDDDSFAKLIGSTVRIVNQNEMESKSLGDVPPTIIEIDRDSFEPLVGSKEQIKKKSISTLDDKRLFVEPNHPNVVERPSAMVNTLHVDELKLEGSFVETLASIAPELSVLYPNGDDPTAVKKEESLAFNYASSHLFADLPPDDDDDFVATPVPIEVRQSGLGEFYNDFSETVTASNAEATKSPYSYLFNDEPPPDDDLFQTTNPKKTISDSDFSRKLDIFANPKQMFGESSNVTSKPKKLNIRDIGINVSALLPGAKRTESKIKGDVVPSSDVPGKEIKSVSSVATVVEHVDNVGRLINLTKNRAKMQSRRPSTRSGRQLQYQKTLEDASNAEVTSSEEIVNQIAPNTENSQYTVVQEIFQAETVQKSPVIKNLDLSFFDDNDSGDADNNDWFSNAIESTRQTATESDEDELDWNVDQPAAKTMAEVNTNCNGMKPDDKPWPLHSHTSLFNDLEELEGEDDILSSVPYSMQKSVIESLPAKTTNSLFDDEDEKVDDLFSKTAPSEPKRATFPPLVAVPTKSLFGDDFSDDDDLFVSATSAKKENKLVSTSHEKETVINRRKASSGKLFSDSDGDDDDVLFSSKLKPPFNVVARTVVPNTTQNRNTKVKASSGTEQDPLTDLLQSK